MAEGVTAIVRQISSADLSADGEFLLIHDGDATAALHRSVFNDLLVALPNAMEKIQRIDNSPTPSFTLMQARGCEIGRLDGTRQLVIRFRLSRTASLAFTVPCEQIPGIVEALESAADHESALAARATWLQ
ncbi:hypothetical protein F4827_005699 [Paraburkholderia bannensis]|jgi:hypothetical protein|uniref:Uncharacterized protein n=1 Tax=Paraburkholderia bannensis TaxID=765414 RepID=A0A7W9U2H1_9BURK|nr:MULTISPECIES: hypothetical protein [Paraburkholderia]MBB3260659.1 hypothetical protein [Paraburkholderia sp. WP4_3_2]MBB6105829.1 hypothetical protein [Paraburkholderia bannensis]